MAPDGPLTTPIVWTPEYAIDIPLLDDQHKVLFKLMDDLRVAVLEQRTADDVSKVMKGLMDYCIAHFHAEEAVMAAVRYPTQQSHAAIHRQFEEKCLGWVEDYFKGTLQPETTLEYLNKWLVSHILHNDRKLAAYIQINAIDPTTFASTPGSRANPAFRRQRRTPGMLLRRCETTSVLAVVLSALLCLGLAAVGISLQAHGPLRIPGGTDAIATALVASGLCSATAVSLALHAALWTSICSLRAKDKESKMAHTRHASDTLLAGQIASRIAAMNLTLMDDLFTNADQSSPLLSALKSIVDNLILFRPHIPPAIFALIGASGSGTAEISPTNEGAVSRSSSKRALYARDDSSDDETPVLPNSPTSPAIGSPTRPANALHRSLKRTFVTCMAVDLADFHTFASTRPHEAVLAYHAEFMRAVKAVVEGHRGVIQLVSGDHALASWNAWRPAGEHTVAACHAALELTAAVEAVRIELCPEAAVRPRLGITSGKALVGIMGCDAKSDFAILSPMVGTAFALAKLNSVMGTGVLVDADVWANASAHFQAEFVAPVARAGSDAAVVVYELKQRKVHSDVGEWMYTLRTSEMEDPLREYNAAMLEYCQGNWAACVPRLTRFLARFPSHSRAQSILRCCAQPPGHHRAPSVCKFGWHSCEGFAANSPHSPASVHSRST